LKNVETTHMPRTIVPVVLIWTGNQKKDEDSENFS